MASLLVYDAHAHDGSPAIVNCDEIKRLPDVNYLLVAYGDNRKELGKGRANPNSIISKAIYLADRHSPVTIEVLFEEAK